MGSLELRVLGPLEVVAQDGPVALPRSKKTRALLALLVLSGRAHRRDRLCEMLWDATDDPRGALRWSLSRLRRALGDHDRIEANRTEVRWRGGDVVLDAEELDRAVREGVGAASIDTLEALAASDRGELLEGLDLPDHPDYYAWCVAERDRARENHRAVLTELVERLRDADPDRAVAHARRRAQVDGFDVSVQVDLLRLLLKTGRAEEARQRYDSARRLFREVGAEGRSDLDRAWMHLRASDPRQATDPLHEDEPDAPDAPPARHPFVGRQAESEALQDLLAEAGRGSPQVALVRGEPGGGKTRLAERLAHRAIADGFAVLSGRAYEAEASHPYHPWVAALDLELTELSGGEGPASRDALFHAVTEQLLQRAEAGSGVLLILDDLQWLDSDSAELLHYALRSVGSCRLFTLLLARTGEVDDNPAVARVLRGIRRERTLREIELGPLTLQEIGALLGDAAPDPQAIHEASAGNPLYAIELGRAATEQAVAATPLRVLVRDRIDRLPDEAADVLRWCAVLGHAVDIDRLEALCSSPIDTLIGALERLERSALLRLDEASERYAFAHDVVREAVYGELSQPRRRLMHRKVAQLLEPRMSEARIATEVAHHAGLAGEALWGVRACIEAGHHSLRVFANGDAESLAKRGLHLVETLDDVDRVPATLDLLHVLYSSRTPDREQAAIRVRALAEQALDLGLTRAARLGFQTLSYLRWEGASLAAAHANIMQAERVSRSSEPEERVVALAQAAKCLVLLERNLGQAEAFAMEADALATRAGQSASAVAYANGMIAAHRGEFDEALASFSEARDLARLHGERLIEFGALEHRVMIGIDRGLASEVAHLADVLGDLGERVRPGAEKAIGHALRALVQLQCDTGDEAALREAIEAVRQADAKYELSYLLTRWALFDLAAGRSDAARDRAEDALQVATAIGRPSEKALALWVLSQCAAEASQRAEHSASLAELPAGDLSWTAARALSS